MCDCRNHQSSRSCSIKMNKSDNKSERSVLSLKSQAVFDEAIRLKSVISLKQRMKQGDDISPRIKGLQDLSKLCNSAENHTLLCLNDDIALLPFLKVQLEFLFEFNVAEESKNYLIYWIRACLGMLSCGDVSCASYLGSKELSLFPILMKIVKSTTTNSDIIDSIELIIFNCSCFDNTHEYLFSPEINWLEYCDKRLREHPNDRGPYQCFRALVKNLSNENILSLIHRNIPSRILSKLSTINTTTMNGKRIIDDCFTFLVRFSKTSNGATYLNDYFSCTPNCLTIISNSLLSQSLNGINSIITLANVYGRDESSTSVKAILEIHPDILPCLVELLDVIMNYDINRDVVKRWVNKGFWYGCVDLPIISIALRNLSISDENKRIMIQSRKLLDLTFQGINSFLQNDPEFKGMPGGNFYNYSGGGGKDIISLENFLELLLQLSFCYHNKSELNASFSISYNVKQMLKDLRNLSTERNVSIQSKLLVDQLLSRLEEEKPREILPLPSSPTTMTDNNDNNNHNKNLSRRPQQQRHIMLSYSWKAKKDLVVEFGKKLREAGYDVWRDEEGSTLCSPLKGNLVESMSLAVENSYAVLIFVSREYKESPACRFEAEYAFNRSSHPDIQLKLIYIILDENYHSRSSPPVEGWLGGMLGYEGWIALWDIGKLSSSLSAVISLLGDNGKKMMTMTMLKDQQEENIPLPPLMTVLPRSNHEKINEIFQMKLTSDADFETAYNLLQDKNSLLVRFKLTEILEDLRFNDIEDLKVADMKTILMIAGLLKPRVSENFLKALRLKV